MIMSNDTKHNKIEQARAALKEKHKKEREQLNARLKDIQAREKNKQRKIDTRQKIIAGALALNHRDKNPDDPFTKKLDALINEYVTKDNERALFDLPPLPANDQNKKRPD